MAKAKKVEYRVNVTRFADNYIHNVETHVVVKATSASQAAELHIKALRKLGAIGEDIQPVSGFSRAFADCNGDGFETCIGRSADAAGVTHRLYVRPESMY